MIRFLLAFAWLRWRLLLNGLKGGKRRDALERLSRIGAVLAPALVVIPFVGLGVALAILGFQGGRKLGSGTADPGKTLLVARAILVLLLALPILVPLGRASHGSTAGYGRLLLLPISRRSLHLVESLAALADPWIAFVVPGLVAFALGLLASGRPVVALLAFLSAAVFLGAIVSLASLASFLADWLMRDRRRGEIVTLVFVLVISCIGILPALLADSFEKRVKAERTDGQKQERAFSIDEFDSKLPAWTSALPSELYARSVRMEVEGRSDRALLLVAALLAEAAVLYRLSSAAHRKVLTTSESGRSRRRAGQVRMGPTRWPFLSPAASAVATVHARNAMRSVRGRLAIFLPGPLMSLLALLGRRMPDEVPFGQLMASQGHALLAFGCLFSLYALQAFHLNQFASDRAGLSLHFLAPIRERDLVVGKAVGGAVIYAVAVGLCVACTAFVAQGGPTIAWLSVLLGAAGTYALLSPGAAALSATLPKTADLSKTGPGGNPHGLAVLIGTFGVMILSAPPWLVLTFVHQRLDRPGLALLLLGAWAAIAIAVASILLRPVARIVAERRENLGLVAAGR